MDTSLDQLQADIAARLRSDEELAGIAVVTERSGDPEAEADMALGVVSGAQGARGVCLVVLQLVGRPETVELPNPVLQLTVGVRVLEVPLVNQTGKSALTIARRVLRVLHHYSPAGVCSTLVADGAAIQGVADPVAPVAYDVTLATTEADGWLAPKVATPRIFPEDAYVPAEQTVTVSVGCDTPDAEILVTTDGSPPYRGNPSAFRYAAPFDADGETLVRAAASKSGWITSDVAAAWFTDPNS